MNKIVILWCLTQIFVVIRGANHEQETMEEHMKHMKCSNAAVTFAVDASHSVDDNSFSRMKEFVNFVATGLLSRNEDISIALTIFGGKVETPVAFKDGLKGKKLTEAIDNLKLLKGNRALGESLKQIRLSMTDMRGVFSETLVLLTTGKSETKLDPIEESEKLRKEGRVNIVVVGIGNNTDTNVLEQVASRPLARNLFQIDNSEKLDGIRRYILKRTCIDKEKPVRRCSPGDVIFVLDSSSSLGLANFTSVKQFVGKLTHRLDGLNSEMRYGVIKYATQVVTELSLKSDSHGRKLHDTIRKMRNIQGRTATGDALIRTANEFSANDRNAVRTTIVITDGGSNMGRDSKEEAIHLRRLGSRILAVGVGKEISQDELEGISSSPASSNTFRITNFDDLDHISKTIEQLTCKHVSPCHKQKLNMMFVLDSSSSLDAQDFASLKKFVIELAKSVSTEGNEINMGVIEYASTASVTVALEKRIIADFVDDVTEIRRQYGRTATGDALALAGKELEKETMTKDGAARTVVLITDGQSNYGSDAHEEFMNLQKLAIRVIGVGVGKFISPKLVSDLSTEKHAIMVSNYQKIADIVSRLGLSLCN